MNYFGLYILIYVLGFVSCNQNNQKTEKCTKNVEVTGAQKDKEEIQKLIQQVLSWSESKESIGLLPVLTDRKDSIYIGFDMNQLKVNIFKLRGTNFFANEFIENYNQIILALDRKLRSKEFETWMVGDLPTFVFANDINPWCLCQGYFSEEFQDIEIIKISSKSGEFVWKWANNSSWKDFKFMVIKEDDKWKISYMEGFDLKKSTGKDGEVK
jgi:hypothetical protein